MQSLSDRQFGTSPGAARVGALRVARELDLFRVLELQCDLEVHANVLEHFLPYLFAPALATSGIAVSAAGDRLPNSAGPEPNAIEALAAVHDNTHDFAVVIPFKCLSNGSQDHSKPEVVDATLALLSSVGPLAAVLVLRVFPLRAHSLLEEVVVGFDGQFGGLGYVVLERKWSVSIEKAF